jgi:hypothetical protein
MERPISTKPLLPNNVRAQTARDGVLTVAERTFGWPPGTPQPAPDAADGQSLQLLARQRQPKSSGDGSVRKIIYLDVNTTEGTAPMASTLKGKGRAFVFKGSISD